ncbi:unnamed protein product, partial [Rotaria magnacalcarata]
MDEDDQFFIDDN